VAAVDRWTSVWGRWWREPWRTEAESPHRQHVPLLSEADFGQWTRHLDGSADADADPTRAWYPVWVDPPEPDEVGWLTPVTPAGWDKDKFHKFVR